MNFPEVKADDTGSPDSSGIALSVERGQATDEELAALIVVLLALQGQAGGTAGETDRRRVAVVAVCEPVQRPAQLAVTGRP
ncbi:acyl-CoA carboxylase subunit epsilon [Streptomyces gelaticus]